MKNDIKNDDMTDDELVDLLRRVADDRRAAWDQLPERGHVRPFTRPRHAIRRRAVMAGLVLATAAAVTIAVVLRTRRPAAPPAGLPQASALVVQRHLAQADSLIEAFHDAVADGTWSDSLTERAQDLVLATRRIQGGRIPADSALAAVLADLDLVFTEMAGAGARADRRDVESSMIEYSLTARDVTPRLRAMESVVASREESGGNGLLP